MGNRNNYDNGEIKLSGRFWALVIALVLALFFVGMFIIGPLLKPTTKAADNQAAVTPMPESAKVSSTTQSGKTHKVGPLLDVQITEVKKSPAKGQSGVKQDASGLTVTMDSGKSTMDATSNDAAQADKSQPKATDQQAEAPVAENSRVARISPTTKGGFKIEVGSFRSNANAQDRADSLKSDGYKSEVKSVQIEDQTVYRVQITGEYSRKSADALAGKLKNDGYSAKVVPTGSAR